MSDMKNFDDFLNAKLNKHTSEVPSHIWDNIVAERNKRKPSGFWLGFLTNTNMLLLTGLLLAGGAGLTILSTPVTANNANKISSGRNNNAINNNSVNFNNNSSLDNSNSKLSTVNSINTEKGADSKNSSSNTNTASSSQLTYSAASLSNRASLHHSIKDKSEKNYSSIAEAYAKTNNEIGQNTKRYFIAGTENIGIIQANGIDDVQSDNLTVADEKNGYSSNTNNSNDNALSIIAGGAAAYHRHNAKGFSKGNMSMTASDSLADNTAIDEAADVAANSNRHNNLNFSSQSYLSNRLSDSAQKIANLKISPIVLATYLPECPTVEKNIAGNKQYIEAYISPDYAIRTLTDSSNANSSYLQQRKQSTSFSGAFSAGLRYTKVFKSGISLAAGLNYSQINEKFSYVENNVLEVSYFINPTTGDTTISSTSSGTKYKTSYNHYHSIDIPLLFGYEMGNDRIHVNVNAGPIMNVFSWQHGEVMGEDSLPQSISSGKSGTLASEYKTNIGLGVTGGVSVFYKLNDQLHVFAEPYFRYNFSTMTNNQSPVQEKYTTIGVHIGVRLDLK